jgi:hypothetical protein
MELLNTEDGSSDRALSPSKLITGESRPDLAINRYGINTIGNLTLYQFNPCKLQKHQLIT